VQFSLAGIPLGSTVNSAIAELNAGNSPGNPTLIHGLHHITAPWLQSAVKWNNAPPFNASPTATAVVGSGQGFKTFTVTPDVQAAVNLCAADHGWMVKDQSETATNDQVNYVSLEDIHPAQLAKRPRLTVDFTPPTCTTNADCADANFCTTDEQCVAGLCVVTPVNCDDGDPCTDDICDCSSGCVNANICNDGFSCTTDVCDPDTLTCTNVPNDAVCSGQCSTGTCLADPDDTVEDPVTGCLLTSTSPDGSPCTDGDLCTSADQCTSGSCGGAPVVCTPLDQCHDAGTCNPGTGICSNPPSGFGVPCSDGSLCTQSDQCNGIGTCVGSNPVVCTPLDQCHDTGTCNPGTGTCSNPPSGGGTPCNDGTLCTQTDQCNGSGTCVGSTPVVCTPLDQCHDTGTCNPGTGTCSNPPSGGGTPCSDGSLCTQTDQCDGAGACVGSNPVVCTPLDQCHDPGTCNPGTGTCSNPPSGGGTPCNDGSLCTQTDQCNGSGTCVGSTPVVCTPLDQCHDIGTCNPGTGICSNPPSGGGTPCVDGNACTQTDECDGSGTCLGANPVVCTPLDQCHDAGTCDTGSGLCSNPAKSNGTGCDDGNTCTITDACTAGTCLGNPVTCGDGVVQAGCDEDCDVPGGGPNCTPTCHFICGLTPQTGCLAPVLPKKAALTLKDKSPDKKDGLNWKWIKGAATAIGDFGTPLVGTNYVLCVYDQSAAPQPLLLSHVPAAGTCGTKPCWKSLKGGFKYNDKLLDPEGIQQILLKSGAATKAKVLVKGKGENIPMPVLPLTPPVTVQLKSDAGVCWEARYSTPTKNLPDQFRAKAD
jgi:hypothetical protein